MKITQNEWELRHAKAEHLISWGLDEAFYEATGYEYGYIPDEVKYIERLYSTGRIEWDEFQERFENIKRELI